MNEGKPDLGQVAYAAYALASDGVSLVSGQPLPGWDDTSEDIRMAWRMSAGAVLITIDQHAEPQPDAGPLLREIILDMARAIRASMNGSGRIARSEVIDWTTRAEVEFDIYAEPGSDL